MTDTHEVNQISSLNQYRFFLKDTIRQHIDFSQTEQSRGVAPPPDPASPYFGHMVLREGGREREVLVEATVGASRARESTATMTRECGPSRPAICV